jgi:hypothetical protein
MTGLVAHADPSTLGDWPWWGWALAAIAIVAVLVWRELRNAPTTTGDLSNLDRADGLGRPLRQCDQRLCTGLGLFDVTDHESHSRRVCSSCFELGWRMGWWVSFADRRPYDREASA